MVLAPDARALGTVLTRHLGCPEWRTYLVPRAAAPIDSARPFGFLVIHKERCD